MYEIISFKTLQNLAEGKQVHAKDLALPPRSLQIHLVESAYIWYLVDGALLAMASTLEGQEVLLGHFTEPEQPFVTAGMFSMLLLNFVQNSPARIENTMSVVTLKTNKMDAKLKAFYLPDILNNSYFDRGMITLWLASIARKQLDSTSQQVIEVFSETFPQRICKTLLRLKNERNEVVGLSQNALAERLSTYRKTVSDILNDLHAMGFVDLEYEKIIIRNPEALALVVSGEVKVISRMRSKKQSFTE